MLFSVRAAVIWLVMLAIPLQGVAASAMLHCGPGHERQVQQVGADYHHGGHPGAGSVGHHQTVDHASADTPVHVGAEPADEEPLSAQADMAQLGKFKCSACAQCCASVALLDRMPAPVRLDPVVNAPLMATSDYPKVAQTGPERPPRSLLA